MTTKNDKRTHFIDQHNCNRQATKTANVNPLYDLSDTNFPKNMPRRGGGG